MKKLVAAIMMSTFLFAGAFGVQAATQSQSEDITTSTSGSDQQQKPKKHHSCMGKHHKKQQQQTQGANDQDSKK